MPDASVDVVATYSVLHHVPDYLGAVRDMLRVLSPGGVLFLDHDNSPSFWAGSATYREFMAAVRPPRTWRRWLNLLKPRWYVNRLRLLLNPRYQEEGDIHVFADDHVEWVAIRAEVARAGAEVLLEEDYLLYRAGYSLELWQRYSAVCNDVRLLIARKR